MERAEEKTFTPKAILLGLGGVLFLSVFAFFNDDQLKQTLFIGNHFPVGVLLYFLPVVLVWNPLMRRFLPRLTLGTRELVIVLALVLTASWVPNSGFYRYFQRMLVIPVVNNPGQTMWQKYKLMDELPPKLFPLDRDVKSPQYEQVYNGFKQGLKNGDQNVGLFAWPVKAWLKPVARWWFPLVLSFTVILLSIALVVHRQWSVHEQLTYPLGSVFSMLFQRSGASILPDVFRSRLFWWGFLPVALLQTLNVLSKWFPGVVPDAVINWWADGPLRNTFGEHFAFFINPSGLGSGKIFFSVVALTFFLPSEIGLSLGVANLFWGFVCFQIYLAGGYVVAQSDNSTALSGAYMAYAAIILFTGRTYYWAVLKRAFFIGRPTPEEKTGVVAFRMLLLSFAAFLAILIAMGLEPLIATCYSLTMLLLFLVFSRVLCETGCFFFQAWQPSAMLLSLFGGAAIGPGPMVFMTWIGTILHQDMRECLLPYVATSLKVADQAGVAAKKRLSATILVGIVVALVVAGLSSSWIMYNWGATKDAWASASAPALPFTPAVDVAVQAEAVGQLEASKGAVGFSKLAFLRPDPKLLKFFLLGFAGVLLFSVLRFRIKRWPLHPVIFLIWGTFPLKVFFYSFFLGWGVKVLVQRFGGGQVYLRLKPLFIGIALGELGVVAASIVIGYVYFWVTGLIPPPLALLPG
ncbi:MAG: hypothetical protein J0L75_15950 [Spirochaetes bacterium]|nr:hypothetical protein [Spirochaetota bacterium]